MYESLVSIIVPVYNVSKYLRQCLDSITDQTYQNLEIILVDDGSEDDSGKICDEYADRDPRIFVVHKENEGLSAARNTGLEHMNGAYVSFVDSDDYIDRQFIEILTGAAITHNTQLVIGAYQKFAENQHIKYATQNSAQDNASPKKYSSREAVIQMLYGRELPMYSPGKLYDGRLFQTLRFPVGRIFEDVSVAWAVMKQIDNAIFINAPLYFYRQRRGSIIHSTFTPGKLDQIYFTKQIVDEVSNNPEVYRAAVSKYFFCLADLYSQTGQKHKKEKKMLENELRKYAPIVKKDLKNKKAIKILAAAGTLHVCFIRIIGKGYKYYNRFKWKIGLK